MVQEIRKVLEQIIPIEYRVGVNAVGALVRSLEKDGYLPESLQAVAEVPEKDERPDLLNQAAREYLEGDKTQETVTQFFTRVWQEWQVGVQEAGINIVVPVFPDTQENLQERLKAGDMPIYIPQEVSAQTTRHLLAKIWPALQSRSVQEGNTVTEEADHSGWRYVEARVEAPYLGTDEEQLRKAIEEQGRESMTVSEYIVGSQIRQLLTGKYFDHSYLTWSRLLGSRDGGRVVYASFDSDGSLSVDWGLAPRDRDPHLGGRSSLGVPKA